MFVEVNMSGNVNPVIRRVKTAIAVVNRTVTKENARSGSEFNFVMIVWTKVREALTNKDS